ncbi:hypothetical protein ACQJBY_063266 [Aegilops geniculata]
MCLGRDNLVIRAIKFPQILLSLCVPQLSRSLTSTSLGVVCFGESHKILGLGWIGLEWSNSAIETLKAEPRKQSPPTPAYHLFDKMSSHPEMLTGGVLRVIVHHVYYPVTEDTLQQVFAAYGVVEISVSQRIDHVEAVVQFRTRRGAAQALALHGRCIYERACLLDIQEVSPDLLPATTAGCLGVSSAARVTEVASPSPALTNSATTTSRAQLRVMLEEALERMKALSTPVASVVAPPLLGSASVNIEDANDRQGAAIAAPHMVVNEKANNVETTGSASPSTECSQEDANKVTHVVPLDASRLTTAPLSNILCNTSPCAMPLVYADTDEEQIGKSGVMQPLWPPRAPPSTWQLQCVEHPIVNLTELKPWPDPCMSKRVEAGTYHRGHNTLSVLERVTSFWTFMREVGQVGG